jgi:hypothetical protein
MRPALLCAYMLASAGEHQDTSTWKVVTRSGLKVIAEHDEFKLSNKVALRAKRSTVMALRGVRLRGGEPVPWVWAGKDEGGLGQLLGTPKWEVREDPDSAARSVFVRRGQVVEKGEAVMLYAGDVREASALDEELGTTSQQNLWWVWWPWSPVAGHAGRSGPQQVVRAGATRELAHEPHEPNTMGPAP